MLKSHSKTKVHPNSKKISLQGSKIPLKKQAQKENLHHLGASVKLNHTLSNTRKNQQRSSRKNKKTLRSKSTSPIDLQKVKGSKLSSKNDEKFIQKLFAEGSDQRQEGFVQSLIEKMLPQKNFKKKQLAALSNFNTDTINTENYQSKRLQETIEKQELTIQNLNNQISELKLYISNFIFKVFDLAVLCRKSVLQLLDQEEKKKIKVKTDQVIDYTESLVRQLNIQNKLKMHCELSLNKVTSSKSLRIRCHTESLKIPVQSYLEEFKKSEIEEIQSKEEKKKREKKESQSLEEMLQFLSRRNSAIKGEDDEIVMTVKKNYSPSKIHELSLYAGQKVTILKAISADRWMGMKDGKVGYFPREVVE